MRAPDCCLEMYPLDSNFSIVSARVAGVPNPLPAIASAKSSSWMSLPAFSIRERRRASLIRAGGFDFSSLQSCDVMFASGSSSEIVPHPSGKFNALGTTSLHPSDLYCWASLVNISPFKSAVRFCLSIVASPYHEAMKFRKIMLYNRCSSLVSDPLGNFPVGIIAK